MIKVYDEDKFIIEDESGIKRTFYKLIKFKSTITNKTYLVYTDNNQTNGKLSIYSSIISNDSTDNIKFEKIFDKIDIDEVNKAINKAKLNIGGINN